MKKNDIVTLTITGMTHDGSGVGRADDLAVFVPGVYTDEICEVLILKVNKTYAFGKLQKLISPSPERIESDCAISKQCGGCTWRDITYNKELQYKREYVEDCMRKFAHKVISLPETLASPNETCYRNKAQYPIRPGKDGKATFGYFAKNSHRVIPCERCLLVPEVFDQIAKFTVFFMNQKNIAPYNENTCRGIVRHLCIRSAFSTGDIMVTLVINQKSMPYAHEFAAALTKAFPQVVSVFVNINTKNTNVIMGQKCVKIYGDDTITDTICGVKIAISPLSFYQINRDSVENLYSLVKDFANAGQDDIVFDLYCGTGAIGLTVASDAKHLYGIEIIPDAVENAKQNAVINGFDNTTFLCGDCKDAVSYFTENKIDPTIVILDPPRKGCDTTVIETVCTLAPSKVVMVSCNPATMARDVAEFENRGYSLQQLQPVDLFPRTPHVETVLLLTKND